VVFVIDRDAIIIVVAVVIMVHIVTVISHPSKRLPYTDHPGYDWRYR
jgi:hypothetical protein